MPSKLPVALGLALSAALLPSASPGAAPPPPDANVLTIAVSNVRNATGHVRVDLCLQGQFLTDHCGWHGEAAAHPGTTTVTVTGVPAGRYAVQAYHDENDNHDVDRAFLGIPKEGIGFSNDAPASFGPPSWDKARFDMTGSATIRLKMRYMLGAGGPPAVRR